MTINNIISKEHLENQKVLVQVRLKDCGFAGYFQMDHGKYKDALDKDSEGWEDIIDSEIEKYEVCNQKIDNYNTLLICNYK